MKKEVPKIIWMLWFQGWENAPELVKKCKASWTEQNPNWTINFLSNENLADYVDIEALIPGYKKKELPPESLSNVIRLSLLLRYGGVWADATLICNQPLDTWLPQYTQESGLFAFANPGPDRLLSTWFLAAEPNNYLIQKWFQGCLLYWEGRDKRHTYFWCHYTFGDLYLNDVEFKAIWDKTPKLTADDPHYFLPYEKTFFRTLNLKDKKAIDQPVSPVYKLTFKFNAQEISSHSVLTYLLSDKKSGWKKYYWQLIALFNIKNYR